MSATRRNLLIAGGVIGAAVAVPAVQMMRWGGKDFSRADYKAGLDPAPEGKSAWMNWSGIERATPDDIRFPDSEEAIADLLRSTQGRIRPVGSGHSFTGLAPTDGVMADLSAMSDFVSINASGLATFQAGAPLFVVADALAAHGRALENLPDINVQTLAGAFSTATHGTGLTLPALHDVIEAFRLVTPSGDMIDVTRDNNPDLFAAGKVSLGALGVITQYTLRTVPAYRLHRKLTVEKAETFLHRIPELGETHRNFEFYYFPSTGLVASIIHDVTDAAPSPPIESEDDDILMGLKTLRDELGWAPWLRKKVARSEFPHGVVEDRVDDSHALLATTRPTRFIEMEYHLPLEEGPGAVARVMKMLDQRKGAFFPMEYRHTAADDAWLSPFNGGPRASIAIHAAVDEAYDYFFTDFEPFYLERGGRPHWGKLHSQTYNRLRAFYPDFDRFNALRRDLDPQGRMLNPHLARIFGEEI